MKICRFDNNRLGVVVGDEIADVTSVADAMPPLRWPVPPGDAFIAGLGDLGARLEAALPSAPRRPARDLTLLSPVANPGKVIAAPINYELHHQEVQQDKGINFGADVPKIEKLGLFLKATSSVVGAGQGIAVTFPDRRIDHEVELAVVIGKTARDVSRDAALGHVAGYTIGLDISVRGTEDRSYRKSLDSFTVLGPWLVTADAFGEPGDVNLTVDVNGDTRQNGNTRDLIWDVPKLIEYAAAAYTLHPGDVILTGTPDGVGPIQAGDTLTCRVEHVGEMQVAVR